MRSVTIWKQGDNSGLCVTDVGPGYPVGSKKIGWSDRPGGIILDEQSIEALRSFLNFRNQRKIHEASVVGLTDKEKKMTSRVERIVAVRERLVLDLKTAAEFVDHQTFVLSLGAL